MGHRGQGDLEKFSALCHLPKQMELGLRSLTPISGLLGIIILVVILSRITAHEKVPFKMLEQNDYTILFSYCFCIFCMVYILCVLEDSFKKLKIYTIFFFLF